MKKFTLGSQAIPTVEKSLWYKRWYYSIENICGMFVTPLNDVTIGEGSQVDLCVSVITSGNSARLHLKATPTRRELTNCKSNLKI